MSPPAASQPAVVAMCWCAAAALLARAGPAGAQAANSDMNAANNPLQPTLGASIQDQYFARYYGLGDADSNALLLRGTLPHKLLGWPQIARLTIPIVTSPELPQAGRDKALGDLKRSRTTATAFRAFRSASASTCSFRYPGNPEGRRHDRHDRTAAPR